MTCTYHTTLAILYYQLGSMFVLKVCAYQLVCIVNLLCILLYITSVLYMHTVPILLAIGVTKSLCCRGGPLRSGWGSQLASSLVLSMDTLVVSILLLQQYAYELVQYIIHTTYVCTNRVLQLLRASSSSAARSVSCEVSIFRLRVSRSLVQT